MNLGSLLIDGARHLLHMVVGQMNQVRCWAVFWIIVRTSFLPEIHCDGGNNDRSIHGAKKMKLSGLGGSTENGRLGGPISPTSRTRTSSASSATSNWMTAMEMGSGWAGGRGGRSRGKRRRGAYGSSAATSAPASHAVTLSRHIALSWVLHRGVSRKGQVTSWELDEGN